MKCVYTTYLMLIALISLGSVTYYRYRKGTCMLFSSSTIHPTKFNFFGFTYPFSLPPLPFAPNAREPYLDAETMSIHHDKHHQAYVDNLNKALEKHPELQKYTIEELLTNLAAVPADIREAVRNHGGGHLNHTLYWNLIAPNGTTSPTTEIANAINASFDSFNAFQEAFEKSALGHMGSGWTWLCLNPDKKLVIISSLNHDNPITKGLFPILVVDIWEHAYYLKYRNKRGDFVKNWWNVVNWDYVEKLYKTAVLVVQ
jgi:superoxide dismutase, Fe-Mn family